MIKLSWLFSRHGFSIRLRLVIDMRLSDINVIEEVPGLSHFAAKGLHTSSFGHLPLFFSLLLVADPLRVLGGDQRLDPLGEYGLGAGIVGIFVGSGPGQPEELLVLQPLGGGAVVGPVLLELVEPLHRLQNDHDHPQSAGDKGIVP